MDTALWVALFELLSEETKARLVQEMDAYAQSVCSSSGIPSG